MTSTAPPTLEPSSPADRRARPGLLRIAAAGVAIAAVAYLIGRLAVSTVAPHLYAGTVLQASEPAPAMDELQYSDGSQVDLTAMEGDLVLVYFGYTNCPDICPTTLSTAAAAIERMGEDGSRVQLLMISVDPARDDPQSLQEYVEFFHPRFRGVGGTPDAIARTSSRYGIFTQIGDGTVETGYLVDHTATLAGIAPDGTLRIVWPPTVTISDLTNDMEELL